MTVRNKPTEKTTFVSAPKGISPSSSHWPIGEIVTVGEKIASDWDKDEFSQNVYVGNEGVAECENIGKIFSFIITPHVAVGNLRRDLKPRRVWSAEKANYSYYADTRGGAIVHLLRGY